MRAHLDGRDTVTAVRRFEGLRDFLAFLDDAGDLAVAAYPVDARYEIAAHIRKSSDTRGPAVLFEKVRGHDLRVVGGVFADFRRALHALGATTHAEAVRAYARALKNPIQPAEVTTAPCKQTVLTGSSIDLTALPIPTYSEQDGGPYITVGVLIAKDPDTAAYNAGIYRLQLHDARHLGLEISPYSDLHAMLMKYEARDQPMEVAIALGVDPTIYLATQARTPYGMDELAIAGGLRGAPVDVVRTETVDLRVPASSEIVIEGKVRPHVRAAEGPFGEFTGYVGGAGVQPVIECTAITMRHEAIFHAGLCGVPPTEIHVIKELALEAQVLHALQDAYPDVIAVHLPPHGGAELLAIASLKQRYQHQAKNVLLSLLGSSAHPKIAIVVDEDVDIYDLGQVLWAVVTRCQPDQDLVVIPRAAGGQLDPSAPAPFVSALAGIDATRPFGQPFAEVPRIPDVDRVPDLIGMLSMGAAVQDLLRS